MAQDWYSRSKTVYLVKYPDGTTDYVDESRYQEIKDRVELLKRVPAERAPMESDHLERFDRYLH